jgi:hypothetical protein
MRTSFTEEQVKILQQHFAIDSNPDGQDLERIAKLTGLKKRVTQVTHIVKPVNSKPLNSTTVNLGYKDTTGTSILVSL